MWKLGAWRGWEGLEVALRVGEGCLRGGRAGCSLGGVPIMCYF